MTGLTSLRRACYAIVIPALAGLPVVAVDLLPASAWTDRLSVATAGRGLPFAGSHGGIRFDCTKSAARMAWVRAQMSDYLAREAIPESWVYLQSGHGTLTYTLTTPRGDSSTLDFAQRGKMDIRDSVVELPTSVAGKMREVHTVSRKEILLALLQHGRLTQFDCNVAALREHVRIRQNIVAWAEDLNWAWPNGGSASWNPEYWEQGTPLPRHGLHEAVNDAFMAPERYGIGCYTATKLVIVQGVLDYYRRVAPGPERLRRLEARLLADGEPLSDIEPGAMWFFETDYSTVEERRPGKLVALQQGIAADNFIPGDWSYLLNTDPASYAMTGYEGSNMIYLGRGRFDDYYNDNNHFYTFRQKLFEVHQWRNGVFSQSRDAAKIRPLSEKALLALANTPDAGGLLESYRGVVVVDDSPKVDSAEPPQ